VTESDFQENHKAGLVGPASYCGTGSSVFFGSASQNIEILGRYRALWRDRLRHVAQQFKMQNQGSKTIPRISFTLETLKPVKP
jgi:hypothetical protein